MNMFPIYNERVTTTEVDIMGAFVMVLVKMRLCYKYECIADVRPLNFRSWQHQVMNRVVEIKGDTVWFKNEKQKGN